MNEPEQGTLPAGSYWDPDLQMVLTYEGRARARAKLDEARARMTPERWDALRERLGVRKKAE